MIVARYGFACILVSLLSNQALAKGGSFRTEDRHNPQHIEGLPSELRKAVQVQHAEGLAQVCTIFGAPRPHHPPL